MKYLSVMISSDGRLEKEVEARIGVTTQVIGGLSDKERKELSRSTKLKIVNSTVMPTFLYDGGESLTAPGSKDHDTLSEQRRS